LSKTVKAPVSVENETPRALFLKVKICAVAAKEKARRRQMIVFFIYRSLLVCDLEIAQ
jgi:hypothetical protein